MGGSGAVEEEDWWRAGEITGASAAAIWLAMLCTTVALAGLWGYAWLSRREERDREVETFVSDSHLNLGSVKLPDTLILDFAQRMDLPEEFWGHFNAIYAELIRCPEDKYELFDFFDWRRTAREPVSLRSSLATAEKETEEKSEDLLFDLSLVLQYVHLVKLGLGSMFEYRADEDSAYDTLHSQGHTDKILPRDKSKRRKRGSLRFPVTKVRKLAKKRGTGAIPLQSGRDTTETEQPELPPPHPTQPKPLPQPQQPPSPASGDSYFSAYTQSSEPLPRCLQESNAKFPDTSLSIHTAAKDLSSSASN